MGDKIDQAVEQAAAPKTKKRPGRPPKEKPGVVLNDIIGLAKVPAYEGDILEFVYYQPMILKKFMALCKAYEVAELDIDFSQTEIKFFAKDHLKKTNIHMIIEGALTNFYYCKDKISIGVKCAELGDILNALDKNKGKSKVQFVLKKDYRSKMYVIITDSQYDKDNSYEIDVIHRDKRDEQSADSDDDYPIKFQLDGKHLKYEINQISKFSKFLTIQKTYGDPLRFTFDGAQRVNYSGTYNNSEKIHLQANMASEDDIFSTTVSIDYIKPFTNTNVGDVVYIAADKERRLSFTTYLDPQPMGRHVVCIKIFTEVAKK